MTMTRRHFLTAAGSAAITLLSACGGDSRPSSAPYQGSSMPDGSTGALLRSVAPLPAPFRTPLTIPPILQPIRRDATTDYYEITQRTAQVTLIPGLATEIWGYNGIFPGPTIKSQRGRRAVIRHHNALPVPTVVHLHGGVTPPDHDGYPTDLVLPAQGWPATHGADHAHGAVSQAVRDYEFPLDQPAATLWYHDHRMDFTGPQVYRGLAGFHLIHDAVEAALPLPAGERDIPLMICDRAFAADGSFMYPALDPALRERPGVAADFAAGVLGDINLVNGTPWPLLEVTATRYRFRLLNASNARNYRLVLDPPPAEGPAFRQIGSDVGLLGQPIAHDRIEIAPAERFDVIIDFAAYAVGTRVTLINGFVESPLSNVMQFHVVRSAKDDSSVPAELVPFEPLRRETAVATREFHFAQDGAQGMWTINGQTFDPLRIDAQPALDTTEIWRISSGQDHPFHLHMAHFQVLGRGRRILGAGGAGSQPGPYDAGWKDTVYVPSSEEVEVIARFTGYRGRYVFHCHNLEHEDMMMMANIEVV